MITVNNGDVKVAGAKEELLADVSSIASFMYEYLAQQSMHPWTYRRLLYPRFQEE